MARQEGWSRWVVAHGAAAIVSVPILLRAGDLVSWLSWHVTSALGESGGAIFTIGIRANTTAAAVGNVVLVLAVPLVLLGCVAQVAESLQRRVGSAALTVFPLAGLIVGAAIWGLSGAGDGDPLSGRVVGLSVGVTVMLLSVVYWVVLAGTLRIQEKLRSK